MTPIPSAPRPEPLRAPDGGGRSPTADPLAQDPHALGVDLHTPLRVAFRPTPGDVAAAARVRSERFGGPAKRAGRWAAALVAASVYGLGMALLVDAVGAPAGAAAPLALFGILCGVGWRLVDQALGRRAVGREERAAWSLTPQTLHLDADVVTVETGRIGRATAPLSAVSEVVEAEGQIVFILDADASLSAPSRAFASLDEKRGFLAAAQARVRRAAADA